MKYLLALIFCTTIFIQGFCDSENENNSNNSECSACHGNSVYKLSAEQEIELGKKISYWKNQDRKKLVRIFKCSSLDELFKFIDKIAALAEFVGHHPDLLIKKNTLVCSLYTHSLNALSAIDFSMAQKIDLEWVNQQKEDGHSEPEDLSSDSCSLIDCNYIQRTRKLKTSFCNVMPVQSIIRDSSDNEDNNIDNSWTKLKSIAARIYRRFNMKSFMTAIDSSKNLVICFDKYGYADFEIYLYYTDMRVDLKNALTEKNSIKPEITKLTQLIYETLKNSLN